MNKEQAEHVAGWLNNLRSEFYSQGSGMLRKKDSDDQWNYCCLGVACDQMGDARWIGNQYIFNNGYASATGIPTDIFIDYFGIGETFHPFESSRPPSFSYDQFISSLVTMNDDQNRDFAFIADRIEDQADLDHPGWRDLLSEEGNE